MRSHPVRDAWIEIFVTNTPSFLIESHPVRDAWIEITPSNNLCELSMSHPVRDAWIEISPVSCSAIEGFVASREGCVDWNCLPFLMTAPILCRIPWGMRGLKFLSVFVDDGISEVASREGCVDWNFLTRTVLGLEIMSHPVRDAWIEIRLSKPVSVLSPRRIPWGMRGLKLREDYTWSVSLLVASREGCVDWNRLLSRWVAILSSRIPWGMRGLKFLCTPSSYVSVPVASREGCVDWNITTC